MFFKMMLHGFSSVMMLSFAVFAQAQNPMQELEEKLLRAQEVSFAYLVTAEGAVTADIAGNFSVKNTGEVSLTASGSFAGQEIDLELSTQADYLLYGSTASMQTADRPSALNEALFIGLTRMGILHNIARLTSGLVPDHAEGGVRDWVVVSNVVQPSQSRRMSFDITVDNTPSGSASLLLDPFGSMVKRNQTVEFETGDMVVVESYSNLQISF